MRDELVHAPGDVASSRFDRDLRQFPRFLRAVWLNTRCGSGTHGTGEHRKYRKERRTRGTRMGALTHASDYSPRVLWRRSAFDTTDRELRLIASAAIIGESSQPV